MTAQDVTSLYRNRLEADMARARDAVLARTEHANTTGAVRPVTNPDDPQMVLYHKAAYFAMIFCIWVAFVSPVLLVITLWD